MVNNNLNTIILIRHGESSYNRDGIIQGQNDVAELTTIGKEQAKTVGIWLAGLSIREIRTSPLKRASESAKIICKEVGLPLDRVITDHGLLEVDFGSWTGKPRKEIMRNYNEQYQVWRNRPYDFMLENRHVVRELYHRLQNTVEQFLNPQEFHGTKVIVAHKGTISALVIDLLKLPRSHHHFLQIDRGSVTIIQERARTSETVDYEMFCSNERPYAGSPFPVDFFTEERTKSAGDVFLVRHGQTDANNDRIYQGGKNAGLSAVGKENMEILSKSFSPRVPTRVVSSPLNRAMESALILASEIGIQTISIRNDLHEFLYGVWEGMSEEDVKRYRESEYNQWKFAPVNTNIPNGEHINNAYNRCREIWEMYDNDIFAWGGSIVSVAHDIVNRLLICNALDLPASYVWRFKQTNASVSVIAVKNTYDGKLRMLNHSPYNLLRRLSDEWL